MGVDDVTANENFRQIAAFAEFGFCKSHAAAFALTAYHTAHLKLYYPAEFYVGLLNNQPMGFYSPAVIAGDAKRHGVAILPSTSIGHSRRRPAKNNRPTCREDSRIRRRPSQQSAPAASTTCGSGSKK